MRCYTYIPLKFLLHSFPLLSELAVPSTELIQCEQCAEDFMQKEIHIFTLSYLKKIIQLLKMFLLTMNIIINGQIFA